MSSHHWRKLVGVEPEYRVGATERFVHDISVPMGAFDDLDVSRTSSAMCDGSRASLGLMHSTGEGFGQPDGQYRLWGGYHNHVLLRCLKAEVRSRLCQHLYSDLIARLLLGRSMLYDPLYIGNRPI